LGARKILLVNRGCHFHHLASGFFEAELGERSQEGTSFQT